MPEVPRTLALTCAAAIWLVGLGAPSTASACGACVCPGDGPAILPFQARSAALNGGLIFRRPMGTIETVEWVDEATLRMVEVTVSPLGLQDEATHILPSVTLMPNRTYRIRINPEPSGEPDHLIRIETGNATDTTPPTVSGITLVPAETSAFCGELIGARLQVESMIDDVGTGNSTAVQVDVFETNGAPVGSVFIAMRLSTQPQEDTFGAWAKPELTNGCALGPHQVPLVLGQDYRGVVTVLDAAGHRSAPVEILFVAGHSSLRWVSRSCVIGADGPQEPFAMTLIARVCDRVEVGEVAPGREAQKPSTLFARLFASAVRSSVERGEDG